MTTPRIEFRHVSKTFLGIDRSIHALDDVSFKVMPGEFVTIIGASGSGKSTLFNLCVGLLEPDEGEILIDGKSRKIARGWWAICLSVTYFSHGEVCWITFSSHWKFKAFLKENLDRKPWICSPTLDWKPLRMNIHQRFPGACGSVPRF